MRRPDLVRRNPDFARFWIGETVSLFGVQVSNLALPLTALLVLQASTEEVGLLRAFAFLPFLLFALPFGAVADRRAKRPLMIMANLVRAVLVALVPVLTLLGVLSLPLLVAIVLGIGICTVMFEVCWLSYVPIIVARDDLVTANARVSGSASAAEFAGPGLGGVLVQLLAAPFALVANGATYLVSVLSLILIKVREQPATTGERRHIGKEIVSGLRFIAGERYLRLLTLTGAAYNFCYMFVEALFVVYAVRVLGLSPGVIGLIVALGALGGLAGAAVAGPLLNRFPFGRVFAAAVVIGYAGPLLIPAATGDGPVLGIMIITGFFLMRAGLAISNVAATSLRQAVTPTTMMARMTAGMRTVSWGIGTTGAIVGGLVGGQFGLRTGLWVAAIGFVLVAIPLLLSRIPRLPSLTGQNEDRPAESHR